jgi:nicotinic acid phosphoribosyltransferase
VDPEPSEVVLQVFCAWDAKLKEERLFIEAAGPWHRVTWLETSLMQAVYDALFRDTMRQRFGTADDGDWYPRWLASAMIRCARSIQAANKSGLQGALFSGRRTGGLPLLLLQALYVEHGLRDPQGVSLHVGISSVTARYWLLDAGVTADLVPRVAGTHAHELSMVLGAVMGEVDDKAGMPLSQLVGHMLYFFLSRPNGDVRDPARKALMPILPDTLGTVAFLKTASMLTVPYGPHEGEALRNVIGAARQDSGSLRQFADLLEQFNFSTPMMASEIEGEQDLMAARDCGYVLFGAGGFFGDSEKAWDRTRRNISMACKVIRVHIGGRPTRHVPVKTGDSHSKDGEPKFEVDGLLATKTLDAIRDRTRALQAAKAELQAGDLQQLFEATLAKYLQCANNCLRCSGL